MNIKIPIYTILTILLTTTLVAQQQTYTITKAPFSTDIYDEFAPVFYMNGIVFCSNRGQAISNSEGKGLVKMYYADTARNQHSSRLFSKELRTKLNEGPATFNKNRDTIFYSRNLNVVGSYKELSSSRNKLGIFYAVSEGKHWREVRGMRFNNDWYNITMPSLSHDGKKLFFSSDRSDGYGGSDIYYSQWRNGYWEEPVNLGPEVNTEGNESYPFMNSVGELFFSSDGRPGLGGKDIFVTKQKGDEWFSPIRLGEPINSTYDDFGIVTDAITSIGYFSSNREKTLDIFKFWSDMPEVWFSEPQKENQYCYTISDTGSIYVDTMMLQYMWDFGDNIKMVGTEVYHCFPGPGRFNINLDIYNKSSGNLFFRKLTYDIEIIDHDQPYISSPDYALKGNAIEFNGLQSYCPGFEVTSYFWDFGDGTPGASNDNVFHSYNESGEFDVRLGLILKSYETGQIVKRAVVKKLIVFDNDQKMSDYISSLSVVKQDLTDVREFDNIIVHGHFSAEEEYRKEAEFRVEIIESSVRIDPGNSFFNNVPSKYTVREYFEEGTGLYSYVIDSQMSLMATYPAYAEMIACGYSDVRVKLQVLRKPSERELQILKKKYSTLTDTYFDSNNRMISNAYLMLDQIVMLMKKYPEIRIEIGVHTDNQGPITTQQSLSLSRAQVIMKYLLSKNISSSRISAKGYGGSRPVASNITLTGRRLNRRIDFNVYDE